MAKKLVTTFAPRKRKKRRHLPRPLNHRKKLGPKSCWRVR